MPREAKRAARQTRAALQVATLPKAAAALDSSENRPAPASRQARLDRAARYVEAARADLATVIHEDQGAVSTDEIAALAAVVAVLRMSDRSLAPGEAAYIVKRTPETVISWCQRHAVGVKVGGRWLVDPRRLAVLLLGCAA